MNMQMCPELIAAAVQSLVGCVPTRKGIVVTTSCLYPDGSAVQVTVKEADGGFYVTDGGRGIVQVRISGHETKKPGYHIAAAAHTFGVEYQRGMVFLRNIEYDQLDTAITLVANASTHGVVRTFAGFKIHNENNFRFAFDSYIRETYGAKFKKDIVAGACNPHLLDYVHRDGDVVVVEPLQPDRMSVDRVFSVHSDIIRAENRPTIQLLVFDQNDDWLESNLRHLRSLGVPVQDYDQARQYLPEIVPIAA